MATVIKVENLSKQYTIGAYRQERYRALRDVLAQGVQKAARVLTHPVAGRSAEDRSEKIWALKDVSFEIDQGDRVGIIGLNGAGKTTLLKIISRITEPTRGRVSIKGRVASLLEVGTGFHPELTGRENIYLNGTILGMTRREIRKRLSEIIAFSGIEKFIDTPVKRYSSGMYVRLAFAVAAHLDIEILLVDEVLAVGDVAFQEKCLGKMSQISSSGRTLLFVSHNMVAVRNLCNRAIYLKNGSVAEIGRADHIIDAYLTSARTADSVAEVNKRIADLPADPIVRLEGVAITQNGQKRDIVKNGQPTDAEIHYEVLRKVSGLRVYFDLLDKYGNILVRTFHDEDADGETAMQPGRYCSTANIPANFLAPTEYVVKVGAAIDSSIEPYHDCLPGGFSFPIRVEWTSVVNRSRPNSRIISLLQPEIKWRTENKR